MRSFPNILQLSGAELCVLPHLPSDQPVVISTQATLANEQARRYGLVRMPSSVECLIKSPIEISGYRRNLRRSIHRAIDIWNSQGLRLEVCPLRCYSLDSFLETIYFSVLAPALYRKRISPHGLQKQSAVVSLWARDILIAVVCDASGQIVGTALLESRDCETLEGLAVGFLGSHEHLTRALYAKLAEWAAGSGREWLSLGRDLPWFEGAYVQVFEQKLRMTSRLRFGKGQRQLYARWGGLQHPDYVEHKGSVPTWRTHSKSLQTRLSRLEQHTEGAKWPC